MRVPSSILTVLKHHAAEEPAPGSIEVPPVALPTLEIPGGLTEGLQGAQSEFRAETFILSFGQDIPPSTVGAIITLAGLRPGLWRLHFFVAVHVDSETGINSDVVRIGLRIPVGGTQADLAIIRTRLSTTPVNVDFVRQFSLERQSTIVVQHAATDVATNLSFDVSLYAARLL